MKIKFAKYHSWSNFISIDTTYTVSL